MKRSYDQQTKAISFQPRMQQSNNQESGKEHDLALYLHIPFCKTKCSFCGIVTFPYTEESLKVYFDALTKELLQILPLLRGHNITSVHLGGGTPSLLTSSDIYIIIQTIRSLVSETAEIIFESNPESLSIEKIDVLSSFSNISLNMGIQSFNDQILKNINRNHGNELVSRVISYTREKNFKSIGIDLICGLPGADNASLISDIETAKTFGVDHIAMYPLWMEPDSYLGKCKAMANRIMNIKQKKDSLLQAYDQLSSLGYQRYSIYHFSSIEEPSHIYGRNQIKGGEWIGIGAGAVSYYDHKVYTNNTDYKTFINNINSQSSTIENTVVLNDSQRILRELAYIIRQYPFSITSIEEKHGAFIAATIHNIVKMLIEQGYIAMVKHNDYVLTMDGILALGEIEECLLKLEIGGIGYEQIFI